MNLETHFNEVDLSIIVPLYNEELVAAAVIQKIFEEVLSIGMTFEVIAVNDGSTDQTEKILMSLQQDFEQLRVVSFYRNWGHMAAISEGLLKSRGQLVVTLDGDFQDPPEYIKLLITKYQESITLGEPVDVVQTVRVDRTSDTFFKRITARIYYKVIRRLTGVKIIAHAADFRLLNRNAINVINSMDESMKIYRILIPYLGLKTALVPIRRDARRAGESKYSIRAMVKLALNSFLSFSSTPLRLVGIASFFLSIFLLLLAGIFLLLWINGFAIPGWTSIVLLMTSINCLVFAVLGLLGEFVSRIYDGNQNRNIGRITREN
jgi:glycosyltransferase involved in cell wall biosynthesis